MPALIGTAILALVLAGAGPASAHTIAAGLHREVHWTWDGWVLASLAVSAVWYGAGYFRLRSRRRGAVNLLGRGEPAAFAAGLATILIALESPIDSISDQLFCVHMIQHFMLLLLAAPLLVWGRPAIVFLWAFPLAGRKRIGRAWRGVGAPSMLRVIMHPLTVWALFCTSFLCWHIPLFYDFALRSQAVHAFEHSCFLVTGLMFWSIVIEPSGRRRLGYGETFFMVAKTATMSSLPGALISLSPVPLYAAYAGGAAAWGLTQLQDQQLAGCVMWVFGGSIYLGIAALLFVKWLQASEKRPRRLAPARRFVVPVLLTLLPLGLYGGGTEPAQADPAGLPATAAGNRNLGAALIGGYGCGSCHVIPGISGANGLVGPPLTSYGSRVYIAGLLANTPSNLAAWIEHPQHYVPGNAMPDMGIDSKQAHDIAAYLEHLH